MTDNMQRAENRILEHDHNSANESRESFSRQYFSEGVKASQAGVAAASRPGVDGRGTGDLPNLIIYDCPNDPGQLCAAAVGEAKDGSMKAGHADGRTDSTPKDEHRNDLLPGQNPYGGPGAENPYGGAPGQVPPDFYNGGRQPFENTPGGFPRDICPPGNNAIPAPFHYEDVLASNKR
jgi:hypothetical protein